MANERALDQQQHGLYADEHGTLRLRLKIVTLDGGDKHPHNMIGHKKGVDNMSDHTSTELRYLEMHQAVSFLLRQESGWRNRRGYEGQNYLMIPMQNMSMEMRMIKIAASSLSVLYVLGVLKNVYLFERCASFCVALCCEVTMESSNILAPISRRCLHS